MLNRVGGHHRRLRQQPRVGRCHVLVVGLLEGDDGSVGDRGAFPSPTRLGALPSPQRGLTDKKIDQLHHLASAALDGALDRDRLRHQTYEEAERQLQQLPGIGPFSAELILIRGMGAPDALPQNEKRLQAATRAAYQLPPDADIAAAADRWRPYRSWIALLMRASN